MRKFIACILMVAMLIVPLSVTAGQTGYMFDGAYTDSETPKPWVLTPELIEHYAYMDFEAANAQAQAKILAARNRIIFSQGWVADGFSLTVYDSDGNFIRETPQFSELFPSDWELPVLPVFPDCP